MDFKLNIRWELHLHGICNIGTTLRIVLSLQWTSGDSRDASMLRMHPSTSIRECLYPYLPSEKEGLDGPLWHYEEIRIWKYSLYGITVLEWQSSPISHALTRKYGHLPKFKDTETCGVSICK